jgi:hypothetical protein
MTVYEDLKAYEYWSTGTISEVLNVGWLGKSHEFPQGEVSEKVVQKLADILLVGSQGKCQPIVNRMRGFFDCELCDAHSEELKLKKGDRTLLLGNAEILIPYSNKKGYYFSAPTLIYHYIIEHHYLPPQEFIDSLLMFNLEDAFPGSDILKDLIERRGGTYLH